MVDTTARERRTPSLAERTEQLEVDYEREPARAAGRLARVYLEGGRARDAVRVLQQSSTTQDIEGQVLLAEAYFDCFDHDKAVSTLAQARGAGRLDDHFGAQLLLGELAFDAGRADDAKRHLRRVLELSANNRRAAELLTALGEPVELPRVVLDEQADAAAAVSPPGFQTQRIEHDTVGRAVIQVVVGLVIGGALLAAYVVSARRAHEAKALVVQAQPMVQNADIASLRAAQAKYQEALTAQDDNAYAIAGLAETHALLWVVHGIDDAREPAKRLAAQAADDGIEKAERFAAEALVAVGEGRYDDAVRVAEHVTKRGGVSEKLYHAVGLAERALGKNKTGRDLLRRAQDLSSGAPHYTTALGDAYDEDNDARNAAFYWGLAAQTNSSFAIGAARALVGRIRKGELEAKLSGELERLQTLPAETVGPRDLAAIALAAATLHEREGRYQEALATAEQGLAFTAGAPRLLALKGRALVALGKIEDGVGTYREALAARPKALSYVYGLAALLADAHKYDEALSLLTATVPEQGDDPNLTTVIAEMRLAKGDLEGAAAAFDRALQQDKFLAEALVGRGRVAARQGKYDAARDWFEKAATARPKFPAIYEAVGLMWIDQKAYDEASGQLETAEQLHRAEGAGARTMARFYDGVVKAFTDQRAATHARRWQAKANAPRKN